MNPFKEKSTLELDPLDRVGWLARQPAFQSWVSENGRWRLFAPGEIIYLSGEAPDGMYGLGAGALEVTFALQGDEAVTLHRAEPGFWIGEAALMAGAPRLVGLSAALESRVFHIPVGALRELLHRDPTCWRNLYEQSFDNLSTALTLLAEALSLSPRARLAKLLLRLADAERHVQGNQEDFGRLIGMTRSSVRRALASLVEGDIVRTGYGCLEIIDSARLETITQES